MPTTWEEYIGAAPGIAPPLGRAQVVKENAKSFKALVAMVNFLLINCQYKKPLVLMLNLQTFIEFILVKFTQVFKKFFPVS